MRVTVAVCMSINYQCTSCYSDCRVQPIISWQDLLSIMVDGFLVVAICVSGIAFAPILYQDLICLRILHYGFLSIFVMAHSSQSMDQRVRRIVFSVENVCSMMLGNAHATSSRFRFTRCLCQAYQHCGRFVRDRGIHKMSPYAQSGVAAVA